MLLGCVTSLPSYAEGEAQDARIQKGEVYYAKYCTPCHGTGGAPGSAVFAATKKPIDLRTYQQRNGGVFPSGRWWDVTFSHQRGDMHSEAWDTIRNDQGDTRHQRKGLSRETDRDIAARGVVANIEYYVMSIQNKNE